MRACAEYLDHADPVVSLMAAQMLDLRRSARGEALDEALGGRVRSVLAAGAGMRWQPSQAANSDGPAGARPRAALSAAATS